MALLTSQQVTRYYDTFKEIDVTFTKEVILGLGLKSKQVFLKFLGEQWPCVIYSTSMAGAKIIVNTTPEFYEKLRAANNIVSLRYSFNQEDTDDPLSFFVNAKVTGFNPYGKDNSSLNFVALNFTQRPPDDLIGIIGELLEININSKKRKEERIAITNDSTRRFGLISKSTKVFIASVPRKGILRDISFSGAKFITQGVGKFLVDKPAILLLQQKDANTPMKLPGKIIRFEEVQGRKDITSLAILYNEKSIPMNYKILINNYLKSYKNGKTQDE